MDQIMEFCGRYLWWPTVLVALGVGIYSVYRIFYPGHRTRWEEEEIQRARHRRYS
jgi:hypothetical protein